MKAPPGSDIRRCVYTVLTGAYEPLNEQPAARASGLPFICFTDDLGRQSDTWQMRGFEPMFPGDDVRNQRTVKIRPQHYLPDVEQSLYIDNSVLLNVPPEQVFAAADLSAGLCLPAHSFRRTLLDEFGAVSAQGLDDPGRLAEQLGHYLAAYPQVLMEKPMWTGLMLRDHRDTRLRETMDVWLAHVYRYSRRDQLSMTVACAATSLQPNHLAIDNYHSAFHSWPHIAGRRTEQRIWPKNAEAEALRRHIDDLQQRLERLQYEHDVLLSATTWRALAPVRKLLGWSRRIR